MLDSFEILSASGVVLWSKSYAPVGNSVINNFIRDVFIEEKVVPAAGDDPSRGQNPTYKKEKYTLKWTSVKDLGLIFVAVYQSLLHLTWIDQLLDNIKVIFVDLYQDQLKKPHTSVVECDFNGYFEQQVSELEGTGEDVSGRAIILQADKTVSRSDILDGSTPHMPDPANLAADITKTPLQAASSTENTPVPTPDSSRPSTPASHILAGKSGPKGASRRARKNANVLANPSSGDERKTIAKNNTTTKKMRKWDDDGVAEDDEAAVLDYSAQDANSNKIVPGAATTEAQSVDLQASGTRTRKGQYVLKDLGDEVHTILQNATERDLQGIQTTKSGLVESGMGAISGLFRNVVGGKVLKKEDLEKPMRAMEEHLLNKNIAREAAVRLREGVERELIGIKTGSFESVDARIRSAMTTALQKILTPTTSLDILHAIETTNKHQHRPYVISIVGVNGVGKSTNLSKLAFFLLQNDLSLLIAACDTFRSGAVEQLRVHVRNLHELSTREQNHGRVELYERGYGKDAANIARDAIAHAEQRGFDVVLIDTAGRRHNDTRLMSSLEKFAQLARPDKILMVGEALVGSDAVAQARAFNAAFGAKRGLDGFIISKCDTVGEMVGTLVSMVHATGIPVVFLGVGQHYGDLRGLSVDWAVRLLMS